MKKQFSVLTIGAMIIGLAISSFGTALISDAAPANDKNQNSRGEVLKPIPAANIKIAKKIPASLAIMETKGRPTTPPGQDKEDDFSERTATGVLGASLINGAKKYAVVIGICDYPGTSNDICLSDGDSYYMVKALIENYGYSPENIYWFRDKGGNIKINDDVTTMDYKKPTHENIRKAVIGTIDDTTDTFIGGIKDEVTSDDEVVFFFSGHGASGTVIDGVAVGVDDEELIDEAIIVHDSDGVAGDGDGYDTLDFIWDGELRSWFYGFNTKRIIFMFDTCLAGGMNDVVRDENNDVYGNRVVVMSSKETQSSCVYSTGEFGEGMFSRYFVHEGMLDGLADGYNQEQITGDGVAVEEAFDYAKENLKENLPPYLKRKQSPIISDEFTGDLIL